MELEIKHLAAYLLHNLKAILSEEGKFNLDSEYPNEHCNKPCTIIDFSFYNGNLSGSMKVDGTKNYSFDFDNLKEIKPILFPLSSLTKEELRLAGFDSHIDYLTHENKGVEWTLKAPYNMIAFLLSKKYDVFGLIEQDLAIAVTEEFNPYK